MSRFSYFDNEAGSHELLKKTAIYSTPLESLYFDIWTRRCPYNSVIRKRKKVPLFISIIVFVVFTVLLYVGKLGEASYSFLIAATALFGLVLHGFDRLKEVDLKNLRIVLREL